MLECVRRCEEGVSGGSDREEGASMVLVVWFRRTR